MARAAGRIFLERCLINIDDADQGTNVVSWCCMLEEIENPHPHIAQYARVPAGGASARRSPPPPAGHAAAIGDDEIYAFKASRKRLAGSLRVRVGTPAGMHSETTGQWLTKKINLSVFSLSDR